METKTSQQATPQKADAHSLDASGFDAKPAGAAMAPQPFQLKADPNTPVQMQRQDPTKFPWNGTVTGVATLPLYSGAEAKEANKVAEIAKGTEVSVTAKSGTFFKVKGASVNCGIKEGYANAANVSGTISELNETVDAMDATMDQMWEDSSNADNTVVHEKGTAIVEKEGKIKNKDIATGGGGSVVTDRSVDEGETFLGDVHTHPYSKDEGGHQGVAFSAGDISNMRGTTCFQGYQKFVEAGTNRFALVITDAEKAKKFFDDNASADITKTWNDAFKAGKGTFQEKVIAAVWAVIGKNGTNGIQFYGTSDVEKKKFDAM